MSKQYQCMKQGSKLGWAKYDGNDPEDVAALYADEYGLEDGEIVVVRGVGSFKISVIMEPEFQATLVKMKG